ncbi:hypothetical protein ABFV99_14690 [Cytobacillus horneckiae]|uniref:hypothetical protein n=1 Tax=Cytobacillus horneckiae TaxID=549687 RepID=UPI0034CEE4EF
MAIPWDKRIYALYKGEENITDGTILEIAARTGKTIKSLRWMTYDAYKERCKKSKNIIELVPIDDYEEELFQ